MEKTLVSEHGVRFSPPGRGLTLGWRLALSTAVIIGLVMGGISFGQQYIELKDQRGLHQRLLAMSLAPLAVRLEAAIKLEAMEREVQAFHTAYVKKGYPDHEVVLLNAANERVLSSGVSADGDNGVVDFQVVVPIVSPLLDGGQGSLVVSKSNEEYRNAERRDWWLWAIHFVVTLGVVFAFLAAAIYYQVTEPVGRLVRVVKKMERGYWKPTDFAGGAWEIRWLAWRFGNMVQEVQIAMTHLLEAEQRARAPAQSRATGLAMAYQKQQPESEITASDLTDGPAYRELLAVCEMLESTSPDGPQAAELGRSVWEQEAMEANRLDFQQVKVRLEDAALRLMEPDAYQRLDQHLSELKEFWQDWMEQRREALNRLLEDRGIPCAGVLYRVKHTAGVWAKMQSKGLSPDDIQDLFAFRLIVPTEADCYAALGVIHQVYKPVIGRFKDYIARPKENGYRSLHTCVAADLGPVFELQIRSVAMDRQAEQGGAAHWTYKYDGRESDRKPLVTPWWRVFFRRDEEHRVP